jgi:hypothetical protein
MRHTQPLRTAALLALLVTLSPCHLVTLSSDEARGDDRAEALAVLDRAIEAHGGATALARATVVSRHSTGTLSPGVTPVPFTDEWLMDLPERFRLRAVLEPERTRVVRVLNGDKGWLVSGGMVGPMGKELLDEVREEVYVLWVQTLVPLKNADRFQLSPLGEMKVLTRTGVGIKVASKGHQDVRLYFDKEGGLLLKVERRGLSGGGLVKKELFLAGYKTFDGVKMPTRMLELVDGRRFSEVTKAEYKFPGKIEASAFNRP